MLHLDRFGPLPEGTGSPPDLDPLALFRAWLALAQASEVNDAEAMTLATVDGSGLPNARTVLLKGCDAAGFCFYTNSQSRKGRELERGQAAAMFHWKSLRRQVRLRGPVTRVSPQEADAYFATRARTSRLGAWASQQSEPLASRFALKRAVAREAIRFAFRVVSRPPHWNGYRLSPTSMEFSLHVAPDTPDRLAFARSSPTEHWTLL